jgi:CRP/FNR family cyclic AMP-dependent transcriptional regulator
MREKLVSPFPIDATSPLFSDASKDLKRAISDLATTQEFAASESVFLQGDEGDALYFVEEGVVEISVLSPDGRKLSLNVMRKGDVFGEIALLDASKRTASAIAIQPSVLSRASRADLFSKMAKDNKLAFDFIQVLCARLRWVHELLEDRSFLPLPVRLAKRVIILSEQVGTNEGDVLVSQSELADFLGATREGVNKVLGSWKARGWIQISRGALRICDIRALLGVASAFDE